MILKMIDSPLLLATGSPDRRCAELIGLLDLAAIGARVLLHLTDEEHATENWFKPLQEVAAQRGDFALMTDGVLDVSFASGGFVQLRYDIPLQRRFTHVAHARPHAEHRTWADLMVATLRLIEIPLTLPEEN